MAGREFKLRSPLPPGEIVKRLLAAFDAAEEAGLPARRVFAGAGLSGRVSREAFELGLPLHALRHPSARKLIGAIQPEGTGSSLRVGLRRPAIQKVLPVAALGLLLIPVVLAGDPRPLAGICCFVPMGWYGWRDGKRAETLLLDRVFALLEVVPG